MAEYAKKLHIRKSGVVTDIKLYSTTGEVGANYLTLKDGTNVIYAKLGTTGDGSASALRVRKSGTTYAVLTQASVPYTMVQYTTAGTFTITIPSGVSRARLTIAAGGGGGAGYVATRSPITTAAGGGGGRGGSTVITVDVVGGQTYTIVVGAGGAYGVEKIVMSGHGIFGNPGSPGGNSSFASYSTTGGGGGQGGYAGYDQSGSYTGANGTSYGSGGLGGAGGTGRDSSGLGGVAGRTGWVYVEYGQGIA